MIMLMWNKCSCCLLLLAAVLIMESSQLDSSSSKVNSIKSTLMGEAPTQATNRSAGIHQGLMLASSKKGKMLEQMGKSPKHYHRQGEVGHCLIAWVYIRLRVICQSLLAFISHCCQSFTVLHSLTYFMEVFWDNIISQLVLRTVQVGVGRI